MTHCTQCGNTTQKEAKFCPECGSKIVDVTSTSTQKRQKCIANPLQGNPVPKRETILDANVVCPKCDKQHIFEFRKIKPTYKIKCRSCGQIFETLFGKIKAKRSRGSKKDNTRDYSIRVIDLTEKEKFIEFSDASYSDFELRSGDMAAFSYYNNTLHIVQNLTINEYLKISAKWCYIASFIYGQNSEEVALLRNYRDRVILTSKYHWIIPLYYRASRMFVEKFEGNKLVKVIFKTALTPIVLLVKKSKK